METQLEFSRNRTLHLIASFNKRYVDVKDMLPKAIVQGTNGQITMSNWIAPSYWHSITVETNGQTRKEKVRGLGSNPVPAFFLTQKGVS